MPEDPADTSSQSPPVWAAYGTTAEDEDFIVGSSSGLRALRDHIDQAIQNGVSRIEDARIEFNGIKCKESSSGAPSESLWTSLTAYGCMALALAVVALAIYGLVTLVR
jgi:hypothetical protein